MQLRPIIASLVFLTLISSVSSALAGTHGHVREGFMIGLNLGGGTAEAKLEGDGFEVSGDDRVGGGAGNFRLGYAISPKLVIGYESSAWLREEEVSGFGSDLTSTTTLMVNAVALTWFPAEGGFFLRGGLGIGTYREKLESGNLSLEFDDHGVGVSMALGYEFRLTRTFALGPQLDLAYVNIGEVEATDFEGDTVTADVTFNYVNLTLLLNWYF